MTQHTRSPLCMLQRPRRCACCSALAAVRVAAPSPLCMSLPGHSLFGTASGLVLPILTDAFAFRSMLTDALAFRSMLIARLVGLGL
eukprot:365526-Chlamydomonas_euryale.AAC.15